MNKKVNIIFIVCVTCFGLKSVAQTQTIKPDISNSNRFQVINRDMNVFTNEQGKTVVHLNGKADDGVAWIKNLTFEKGIVEFDVKGKNIMQQSFVGIAFHGINDSIFDAIYFRPFNFLSDDSIRKKHSVQYISMPKYDWSLLRQTFPGKYENALTKNVEPDKWFHAKIIIGNENIEVFINNDDEASLIVKPLSNNTSGKIGFWVGNNSDGDFSNLTIKNN